MGSKKIWDGKDLPEKGDLVLTHLGSNKAYVPHKVEGFRLNRLDTGGWQVWVDLSASHDSRSSSNTRNLEHCFPLDTDPLDLPVDGCHKTPREAKAAKDAVK